MKERERQKGLGKDSERASVCVEGGGRAAREEREEGLRESEKERESGGKKEGEGLQADRLTAPI